MPLKNGRRSEVVQVTLTGTVVPPGTVAPFGGTAVPLGWLICDGSTISRTEFPTLFEAIGTIHGAGDGSTTFHLPDYRGRFLRGSDDMGTGAAGRDPDAGSRTAANSGGATGATVGSVEDKATALPNVAFSAASAGAHTHSIVGYTRAAAVGNAVIVEAPTGGERLANAGYAASAGAHAHSVSGGDTETRPINANTNYIIKI